MYITKKKLIFFEQNKLLEKFIKEVSYDKIQQAYYGKKGLIPALFDCSDLYFSLMNENLVFHRVKNAEMWMRVIRKFLLPIPGP